MNKKNITRLYATAFLLNILPKIKKRKEKYSFSREVSEISENYYYIHKGNYKTNNYILLTGGIHGDEQIGTHILLKLIRKIKNKDIVVKNNLIIIPCINKSGIMTGKKLNSNNVDLNRNFSIDSEENYEKETMFVKDVLDTYSHKIIFSLSFHSGGKCICHPPDSSKIVYDDELVKKCVRLAKSYDAHEKYFYNLSGKKPIIKGLEWYEAVGTFDEWIFYKYKIPCICVELDEQKNKFTKKSIKDRYFGLQIFLQNCDVESVF